MNTPAHLVFGLAAFGRQERPATIWASLAGALAPDLSLYMMAGVSIWGLGVPAATVFREYYYSDAWQTVFAVDNSFIVWAGVLLLAVRSGSAVFVAFAGAALLHLAFDFPLHNDDARRHFWPISDWVFVSPVSYWDDAHFGRVAGPVEVTATLLLCAICLYRFRTLSVRLTVAALALMEASASGIWRYVF